MANTGMPMAPQPSGWRNIQSYESRQRAYLENLRVQKQNHLLYRDLALGTKKYKCPSTPPNTRPGSPTFENQQSQYEFLKFNGIAINIIQEELDEPDVNLSLASRPEVSDYEASIGLRNREKNMLNSLIEKSKFGLNDGSGAAAIVDLTSAYDEKSSKTQFVPYSTVSTSNNRLFTANRDYQEKMPYYFSGYNEASLVKQLPKKSAKSTKSAPREFDIKQSKEQSCSKCTTAVSTAASSTYRGQTKQELALLHKRIFNTGLSKKPLDPFE